MKELTLSAVRDAINSCVGKLDGIAAHLQVTATKLWRFIFSIPYYRRMLDARLKKERLSLGDQVVGFAQALRQPQLWATTFRAAVAFEMITRPGDTPDDQPAANTPERPKKSAPRPDAAKASSKPSQVTPTDKPTIAKISIHELSESVLHAAFYVCGGMINLTIVATHLGLQRDVIWNFIRGCPSIIKLIVATREVMVNMAERVLFRAIDRQKKWAVRFMQEAKSPNIDSRFEPIPPARKKRPRLKPSPSAQADSPPVVDRPKPAAKRPQRHYDSKQTRPLRSVARKLGVTPEQLLDYLLLSPELQAAYGDRREELLDDAETKLDTLVEKRRPWAVRFVLYTLGRLLGYRNIPRSRYQTVRPPSADRPSKPRTANTRPSAPVPTDMPLKESVAFIQANLRTAIDKSARWAVPFVLLKMGQSRGYIEDPPTKETHSPAPTPMTVEANTAQNDTANRDAFVSRDAESSERSAGVPGAEALASPENVRAEDSFPLSPALPDSGRGKEENILGQAESLLPNNCDSRGDCPSLARRANKPTRVPMRGRRREENRNVGCDVSPTRQRGTGSVAIDAEQSNTLEAEQNKLDEPAIVTSLLPNNCNSRGDCPSLPRSRANTPTGVPEAVATEEENRNVGCDVSPTRKRGTGSVAIDAEQSNTLEAEQNKLDEPAVVASPEQMASAHVSDESHTESIPSNLSLYDDEKDEWIEPTPIVVYPAEPGETDWSQFSQRELIEFEHLFARVFGMEDRRIPFNNSRNISIRTIMPDAEYPPPDESRSPGSQRPPPEAK